MLNSKILMEKFEILPNISKISFGTIPYLGTFARIIENIKTNCYDDIDVNKYFK